MFQDRDAVSETVVEDETVLNNVATDNDDEEDDDDANTNDELFSPSLRLLKIRV